MSIKKVQHVADLPEWFDIKKYETTLTFTPLEWANHLGYRKHIRWLLGRNNKTYIDDILSQFERIKEDPTHHIRPRWLLSAEDDIQHASTVVRPLTCGLAHALGTGIENTFGLNESGSLGPADRYSVSKYYKDNDLHMDSVTPLVIDLNCSDVDIKNDFNRYLEQVRNFTGKKNKKTHITKNDLDRLQRYKILPYIDLLIWSEIEGRTIHAHVLITALFGDSESIQIRGEAFIAETVKPFFNKLNDQFLRALHNHSDKHKESLKLIPIEK